MVTLDTIDIFKMYRLINKISIFSFASTSLYLVIEFLVYCNSRTMNVTIKFVVAVVLLLLLLCCCCVAVVLLLLCCCCPVFFIRLKRK